MGVSKVKLKMLPLSLLNTAKGQPMLVEMKNGDTYNGRLQNCNMFMNLMLKDVICTSRDGDKFFKMEECYIHGNNIKYLRLPEDIVHMVPDESNRERKYLSGRGGGGRTAGRVSTSTRTMGANPGRGGRDGGREAGRGGGREGGRGGRGDGRGHDGRGFGGRSYAGAVGGGRGGVGFSGRGDGGRGRGGRVN